MSEQLLIRTLGGVSIRIGDKPITGFDSRKVPALLVYLACTRRTYPREVLAEMLWEERTQAQALSNLRVALHSLNQMVGDYVEIARETVGLNLASPLWLDVEEFEDRLASGCSDQADLEATLALYQGDFLEGFYVDSRGFEDWALLERERLRFRAMEVLDLLINCYLGSGQYADGIASVTRLLQMDTLREKTHRQFMELLEQSGQRSAALGQYETCRRLLHNELGIAPTEETTALFQRIQRGESNQVLPIPLVIGPTTVRTGDNPYKGLRPFQEADAADFFGREALVARLVARLREDHPKTHFLAVVGPSGSGKSSVVRAGLIPALRSGALSGSGSWCILDILPGSHPLEELEAALRTGYPDVPDDLLDLLEGDARGLTRILKRLQLHQNETNILLLIDQFEEVFMLVEEESVRRIFLDSLLTALTEPRSRLWVVITLRADFYDRPLLYPTFGDWVQARTEVVLPLSPTSVGRAIIEPAMRAGVKVEPDLVTTMVAEVSEQPGVLPLFQYALTELFEQRQDQRLTLEGYQKTGGVRGALTRRADELYSRLTPPEQEAARQLFLRLIHLGEGIEDTRRRVQWDEASSVLGSGIDAQSLIDRFTQHRLLTLDHDPVSQRPTVEVAHEALIHEWRRLRDWLDESRDDMRLQRMLAAAAAEWQNAGQDRSYLLTGSRLAQFENWVTVTTIAVTPDETDYLSASITERKKQEAVERERQAKELALQKRAARNLRYLVAGLTAFLLAALGLSLFAFGQRNEAQDARATSDTNAKEAQNERDYARELALVNGAREALVSGDMDTALALAVTANRTANPSAQAQMILSEAAYAPGTVRVYDVNHVQSITNVSLSPDGRRAVSAAWGSTVTIWDVETGTVLHELLDYKDGWTFAIFSPDAASVLIVTGNTQGTQEVGITLWDAASGSLIRTFDTDQVLNLSILVTRRFSPDGRWYVGSNGGGFHDGSPEGEAELIIWDVSTGQVARTIRGFEEALLGAEFSPDGRTILTVMNDATLAVVDVETGQIIQRFGERQEINTIGWFNDILFTPDGRTAITVRSTGTVIVWNMETHQEIRRFEAGANFIAGNADLSADGKTLAVAAALDNGIVSLWNVPTGTQLTSVTMPGGATSVKFLPGEQLAVVALGSSLLRLIELEHGAQHRFPMVALTPYRSSVAVGPDGNTLLACIEAFSDENDATYCQVALFDVATGAEIRRIGAPMALDAMHFSPDGHQVVLASNTTVPNEYLVTVWDVTSEQEIARFEHTAIIHDAAFSPDGSAILLGDNNGLGILWEVQTSQVLAQLDGHTQSINDVEFSPDGRKALTSSQDGLMILWDVATGQEIRRFDHGIPVNSIEFSPDGQMAISGSDDSLARLWDLNTGSELRRFVGHTGLVYDVHFSPDGHTAFTSGFDEVILQWDVATGQTIRRYPRSSTWTFEISPDGRSLFIPSSEPDSAIYQYRVDTPQELLNWTLEHRYVRDLSCEERAQYRIEPLCE